MRDHLGTHMNNVDLGKEVIGEIELPPTPHSYLAGRWALVLLGLAALGLAGFLVRGGEVSGWALIFAASGVFFLALGGGLLWAEARTRCWLTFFESGFTIRRAGKTDALRFSDIDSITISDKPMLSNGVLVGRKRRLKLRTPRRSVRFKNIAMGEQQDQVGQAIEYLVDMLGAAGQDRLAQGKTISGKGWSIDDRGIHTGGYQGVPLTEIVRVGGLGDSIKVWKRGQTEAFLKVPHSAENAPFLAQIASRHVPEDAVADDEVGIGLCLASKKRLSVPLAVGLALFGLLITLPCVVGFFGPDPIKDDDMVVLVGGCIFGLLILFATIVAAFSRFQIFEQGIRKRSLFGERELLYSDIESLSFNQTRNYVNGAYTGTSYKLSLNPVGSDRPLRVSGTAKGDDEEVGAVEQHITPLVAEKMFTQLENGQPAAWGRHAQLTREGIQVTGRSGFAGGKARLVPYSPDLSTKINGGICDVFAPGEKKRFLRLNCDSLNFYPGLLVIEHKVSNRDPQAGSA